MRQFGFFLGIAIGVILILFGSIVIFQALPAALDVLEMPSRIPFVREVYTWLMTSANGLTAQLEQNFLEAFQTVLKLILLITFMWVCVKLVNMGVLIIRAGVDLIRTAIAHRRSRISTITSDSDMVDGCERCRPQPGRQCYMRGMEALPSPHEYPIKQRLSLVNQQTAHMLHHLDMVCAPRGGGQVSIPTPCSGIIDHLFSPLWSLFMPNHAESALEVRLDKWLWAARFYKTRSIARDQIDGGKVHYNGQRSKPGKQVEVGALIRFWQGQDEREVRVLALSEQRKSAPLAQQLYEETAESLKKRAENSEARRFNSQFAPSPERRPDKQERRQLLKVKQY
mgnify:CR=1 FL=1